MSMHCICNKETNEILIITTNHQTIVKYFKDYKLGVELEEPVHCEWNILKDCFRRGFYDAT